MSNTPDNIAELEGYHFIKEIPVAWGDMDAFGHVNNVLYIRYFETARVAYFDKLGYMEQKYGAGCGPIIASLTCNYRRPAYYPDTLLVGVRVLEPKNTSFIMEYAMYSQQQKAIVADGQGIIVHFDYGSGQKAEIPQNLREDLAKLEHRSK